MEINAVSNYILQNKSQTSVLDLGSNKAVIGNGLGMYFKEFVVLRVLHLILGY